MDIHKVELYLTSAQKNKFLKGTNFQMTNSQLESKSGKHKIDVNLSENNYNDLLNKISKKKSYRFKKEVFFEGSGIFRDISKGLVKIAAPIIIDKGGDVTGTRKITDAIVKPNADKVIDFVGSNVKKGRLLKGSQETKDFMQSTRKKKNGANVFDDIGNILKLTFTPDLGRKIKDTLSSDIAKKVYKVEADTAIPLMTTQKSDELYILFKLLNDTYFPVEDVDKFTQLVLLYVFPINDIVYVFNKEICPPIITLSYTVNALLIITFPPKIVSPLSTTKEAMTLPNLES